MGLLDMFTDDQRLKNVLMGIFNMLLILGIYFLGHNSAVWTNEQIEQYCSVDWCNAYRANPLNLTYVNSSGVGLVNFTLGS